MQETEINIAEFMDEVTEKLNRLDGDPDWKQKISNIVRKIILEFTG